MISTRTVNLTKDYKTLEGWWHGHGLPSIPRELLPDTGLFVREDETDCAAGWVYIDSGGKIAVIDWITTNPALSGMLSMSDAVRALNDALEVMARLAGCGSALTFVADDSGLERLLENRGWMNLRGVPHTILGKRLK